MSKKDEVRPEYVAPTAHAKSPGWPTKRISREEATARFGEPKGWSTEECAAAIRAGDDPLVVLRYALAAAEERGRRRGVEAKDAAYAERNQCVALIVRMALALGWRAGVRGHEDKPGENWEADWRNLVCIDLPTGQVSWHFHDSEKHLLAGLPRYPVSWDGHDTAEKYRRVNAALAPRDSAPAAAPQAIPGTHAARREREKARDSGKEG